MNRPSLMKKVLSGLLALCLALTWSAHAQGLTTSSVNGTVTDKSGVPIAGATVTIVHEPSGTRATTVTRANGQYSVSGLRVGGPYTISAASAGLQTDTQQGVSLDLGQTTDYSFQLGSEVITMQAFNVSESSDTTFGAAKMSTSTEFNESALANAPTVRRNLQDIARLDSRLTLNSLDQGGQLSAQGQNFRFNSLLIDGVQANDPYGLNSNGFASLRSPIPVEALEALTIELSPYDVSRAGFTGALLNAVTKTGTNTFSGSLYAEYSDQDLRAKSPITGVKDTFKETTWGATLGGPIIKNKLFFFLSYDNFKREAAPPGANFVPDATQIAAIVARAQALGYNPGVISEDSKANQESITAKIDWNISDSHRASFTYRKTEGEDTNFASYTGTTGTSLSNYWYQQPRLNESYRAQLVSNWTPSFSTEANIVYAEYDGSPVNRGSPFPEVTIQNVTGVRRDTGATVTNGSVRLGTELSRQLNFLTTKNTVANVSAKYALGNHTLSVGLESDETKYSNKFVQAYYGSYTFANITGGPTGIQAWQAGGPPTAYTNAAPFPGRALSEAYALWKYVAQSIYLQDTWRPTSRLTLNGGVRFDNPYVPDAPPRNTAFETAFGIRNDTNNDGNYTIAPRAGFSYALNTDRKTQLRGGLGLFQGKNPAVWISNAYSAAGAVGTIQQSNAAGVPITFQPDVTAQPIPPGAPFAPPINVTDPNFKQPVLWKGNLALDHELPFGGLVVGLEVNATKTVEAVNTTYLNYQVATTGPTTMPDGRVRYAGNITSNFTGSPSTSTNGRRRVSTFADVYYLTNSSKGRSEAFTLSLNRPMKNGWGGGVSVTRSDATEVSPATSSTASSNYNLRAVFNPNEDVASTSNTNTRDKIVAVLTKEFRFIRDYKTTVSLVYEGRSGRPYSWVFRGDANGDGFTFNDLFYMPDGINDPKVRWNTTAERDQFFAFAEGQSVLMKNQGKVVGRNTDTMPWVNTLDLKLTQELPIRGRLRSELYLNVINFANLFDDSWGILEEVDFAYRRGAVGATYDPTGNGGAGQYVYAFQPSLVDAVKVVANDTPASRWQVQMGIRVKF